MTQLTFYGGVNEVGGNKILLTDGKTRVFLDFGISYSIRDMYYDKYLDARSFATIDDYAAFGQLPKLPGLYRTDHLKHADPSHSLIGEKGERAAGAVLISHGHIDHVGLIPYLRPDISLLGSELTKRYLQFVQDSKTGMEREYLDWYPAFELQKGKNTWVTRSEKTIGHRDYKVLEPKKAQIVGGLEITAYPVDHSIQGALAYTIATSSGNIAYTGDIRFHGYFEKMSNHYMEALEKKEIKVLLCEGTRAKEDTDYTESELQSRITSLEDHVKGMILANYYQFDISRTYTIAQAAAACGRTLLVNPKQAYYMSLIEGEENTIVPSRNTIGVLMPRKEKGVYGDPRFEEIWDKDYDDWRFKDSILERSDLLTPQDVAKAPSEYVVSCTFYELNLLHDLKPPDGSIYLWSRSQPFDEEGELEMKRVLNWLSHFGLGKPVEMHCSGHMGKQEIRNLIDRTQPDIVVPIHTEDAGLFKDWHSDVRILRQNDVLPL